MGTKEEREANDLLVGEIIELCSNGNKDAERYLFDFAYAVRVFDDLIDKDYPVSDAQIYKAFFALMAGLWLNPFFIRNSRMLIALHVTSCNAFFDSNTWAKDKSELKKVYSHVVKDFVNELFGMVAFLTGGYNHMRKVSLRIRGSLLENIEGIPWDQ